jgi:hypothetical protein
VLNICSDSGKISLIALPLADLPNSALGSNMSLSIKN